MADAARQAWRRIGPEALPPEEAVERPVRLLETMQADGPAVISWSTVTHTCLVLGRTGRPSGVNTTAATQHGVPVVDRRSGGAPVLWDHGLLSLDVVVPPTHPRAGTDITVAYQWLGFAVAAGLRELGIDGQVVPIADARAFAAREDDLAARARRACFGGLSPFEVVGPDGRKIVGLSQARRRYGVLFQCGVLVGFNASLLAALLEDDEAEGLALEAALMATTTGINTWNPGLTTSQIAEAITPHLVRALEDPRPNEIAVPGGAMDRADPSSRL